MRAFLSILAVSAFGLAISTASSAGKDDFDGKGKVTAKRGADGKVTVVIKGTGDWHVNGDYDLKVTVGEKTVRKADGAYKWVKGEENKKADSVTFSGIDDKADAGEAKAVFCDAQSCTSPIKASFSVSK
jgi:hypothetical protein